MAVNPTGAIFKTLEFDGVSSRTYGIYITGDAVYDAPARDVEMVTIPGRNGSFAQDNGRFENITVTYPAGIYADTEEDYAEAVSEFRNFLCSRRGYCRLEDDYNPDEYRMAIYKSGLDVDTKQLKAGQFSLEFECKPQRFLKSGEEVVTIDDSWRDVETETGDIVEVSNPVGDLFVKNITADIEPKQDGTPWQSPAESVPYLFRQSSGGAVDHDYFNELDTLIGGTVAWNQLVANSGSVSVSVPSGHKYYSNIGGTKAIAISDGSAISATGGTDNIVDLTQMLGSTIADYVYSLEQTTSGSGVAWLKAHGFCTKDYYAYDAGSLKSVKTSAHVMRDENDVVIGNYPLDSDLELRGIPKLDANNNLYYDGDEYASDGSVTRNWGEITFDGSDDESWGLHATIANLFYINVTTSMADAYANNSENGYAISNKYIQNLYAIITVLSNGEFCLGYPASTVLRLAVKDTSCSTASEFKTKLASSPMQLAYKLTTPTTETADPFTSPQIVDPSGTEEYVDTRDVPIPVGHRTNYAEIYPIIGVDEVDVFVSPTTSEQDATVYTADLNGTRYGGEINLTTGVLKTCPYYSSYNGETLTGEWLSDRDVYAAGTTPSIGAQVVNIGGSRTTTQLTTTEVSLLVGPNNVWADTGEITLEYGRKGNVLGNPTRFDASPLLEIEGYGTISLNGYEIELDDDLVGEVTVPTPPNIRSFPYLVTFPNVYVSPNDSITLAGPKFNATYMSKSTQTNITSVEVSSWSGDTSTAPTVSAGSHSLAFTARFDDPTTFNYGVASEKKITFSIRVVQGGSSYHISNIICSVAYDGDKTITFDTNVKDTSRFTVSSCYAGAGTNSVITINSTATTYGHPTYIDCDLGEAYADDDGVISSLNSYIALGSQLPELSPGANEVAYDNTILSLKIQPRWWKI